MAWEKWKKWKKNVRRRWQANEKCEITSPKKSAGKKNMLSSWLKILEKGKKFSWLHVCSKTNKNSRLFEKLFNFFVTGKKKNSRVISFHFKSPKTASFVHGIFPSLCERSEWLNVCVSEGSEWMCERVKWYTEMKWSQWRWSVSWMTGLSDEWRVKWSNKVLDCFVSVCWMWCCVVKDDEKWCVAYQIGLTPSSIMCNVDLGRKLLGVGILLKHSQNAWQWWVKVCQPAWP